MSDSCTQDPMNTQIPRDNTNNNLNNTTTAGVGSRTTGNVDPQTNVASRYGGGNQVDQMDGGANAKQSSTYMESNGGLGSRSDHIDTSRTTGGQFNDYGITEVGRGGSGGRNQDINNDLANTGIFSGMEPNSGLGQTGGFDVGSGADTGLGRTGGGFGTASMDQNSGAGQTGAFDVGSGADTGAGIGRTDDLRNTGIFSGMEPNSGLGQTGGFDVGSGADTGAGAGIGRIGGGFGTASMDQNSGPGVGGGFDVGSGADTGGGIGRAGGNVGTSSMDQNSGPGVGGGFDAGSGAGTGGYKTTSSTNAEANEYGSGTRRGTGGGVSSDDYSHNQGAPKPSTGDKIKGGAEKLAGKVTKNPELVEKGQQRKQGDLGNDNAGQNF
ncbi:hypothetical protein B0H12DRAFT_685014 [Mycena haematopus]|nr:hypothetical protein B0H12DRAFT_685014 [Mycena haematopus]